MANQIKTPLLRPLRASGATMYTFPSAAEDISLNINNSTQGVAISHYALLNFTKNNFNLNDRNTLVASLQNELMNNEVALLNQSQYNFQEPYTVSEQVFWKWLRDNSKLSPMEFSTAVPGMYRESHYRYDDPYRIVQCFGQVDAGNYLSSQFGMYNETYISVPTSYGNGAVFFRSVNDNPNYMLNTDYVVSSTSKPYIQGRDAMTKSYINDIKAKTATYSDNLGLEIVKDIPSIQLAMRAALSDQSLVISSYDDINVDAACQFTGTTSNQKDSNAYAVNSGQTSFKFNAILLYYSIYNLSDVRKDAVATNLFSIIFLDGGQDNTAKDTVNARFSNSYVFAPVLKKKSYKSKNSDASYFGSSYAFRVNIRTMSVYDNTDATIQDNTTTTSAYSQDFNDVLSNFNKAIDVMNTNMRTTAAIQDSYSAMRSDMALLEQNVNDMSKDIENRLSEKIEGRYQDAIKYIDSEISRLESSYEVTDFNDETPTDGSGTAGLRTISKPAITRLAERMGVPVENAGLSESSLLGASVENLTGIGQITDTKVNIISATNANVNATKEINLTGRDINFYFRKDGQTSKVPVSSLISRINSIEEEIEALFSAKRDVREENALTVENLIAMGIIPIVDILQPRAKKPEQPGFYLKANTSGQIQNYVLFDGEDYAETIKCESGKMFTCKGVIYAFNGETCKPLGS